jgi:hypothetical protein
MGNGFYVVTINDREAAVMQPAEADSTLFRGPLARQRAKEYADFKNGDYIKWPPASGSIVYTSSFISMPAHPEVAVTITGGAVTVKGAVIVKVEG